MSYQGDFDANATVYVPFTTVDMLGESVTFTGTTIRVYKDGGTTERSSSSGITLSKDFDGVTGVHIVSIDTSDDTDPGFFSTGSDYAVMLQGATIDSETVNAFVGSFSIENRNY